MEPYVHPEFGPTISQGLGGVQLLGTSWGPLLGHWLFGKVGNIWLLESEASRVPRDRDMQWLWRTSWELRAPMWASIFPSLFLQALPAFLQASDYEENADVRILPGLRQAMSSGSSEA